mmetsp:Transcript_14958/g.33765  ORF Transcript_14958/g.33765 Transcript_14958/m.33765 type:complete len:324 (-) Transcript_14958:171-1142(-)
MVGLESRKIRESGLPENASAQSVPLGLGYRNHGIIAGNQAGAARAERHVEIRRRRLLLLLLLVSKKPGNVGFCPHPGGPETRPLVPGHVEQYALVLVGASVPGGRSRRERVRFLLLGGAFHQHQAELANLQSLVLGVDPFPVHIDEFLQAALLGFGGNVVPHRTARVGLVAHGVGKEKGLFVADVFQQGQRIGVLLFRFVAKTGDEIRRDRDVGDHAPDGVDQLRVGLPRVAAFHPLEHGRVAALRGHVQLRTNVRRFGHELQELGGVVLRVGAGVPDPQFRGDLRHGLHQIHEAVPPGVGPPDPRSKALVGEGQDVELGAFL